MSNEQLGFDWEEPDQPRSPVATLKQTAPLAARMHHLARMGIYIGTSSWKYQGWLGQIYNPNRYETRGKFSKKKFNDECLEEYAQVFPTVCGDFAFYQFPTLAMWRQIFSEVPAGFRFSLKVPEDVTVERFPNLPRYGQRAGVVNPRFMDAAVVEEQLLRPLERFYSKLGTLIFEFGTIHDGPLAEPRQFTARLEEMLSRLPTDRFHFGVEVRNPDFLNPSSGYLECLHRHGVAHCFNSWTRMPAVGEQLNVPDIFTARHAVARFLLPPGRTYNQAVAELAPYERVQQPYPEGRRAMERLIRVAMDDERTLYVFVNNRLEGNAIQTIDEVTGRLE
jgi:uncharacterized protein YecE (DUF72 family)